MDLSDLAAVDLTDQLFRPGLYGEIIVRPLTPKVDRATWPFL